MLLLATGKIWRLFKHLGDNDNARVTIMLSFVDCLWLQTNAKFCKEKFYATLCKGLFFKNRITPMEWDFALTFLTISNIIEKCLGLWLLCLSSFISVNMIEFRETDILRYFGLPDSVYHWKWSAWFVYSSNIHTQSAAQRPLKCGPRGTRPDLDYLGPGPLLHIFRNCSWIYA